MLSRGDIFEIRKVCFTTYDYYYEMRIYLFNFMKHIYDVYARGVTKMHIFNYRENKIYLPGDN